MLRQDNDLVSVWAESNGPQLVIAFAGLGEVGSSVCWGADYFRKAGFSFVSFVPKKPHWYPALSFQVSAEIAQFIGQYSERITYGYSMGGHAALKAGGIFGASRSVALCPQYSVDPKVIADHRYNKYWMDGVGTHHMMFMSSRARRIVFCDGAHVLDRQHVSLISQAEPVDVMNCVEAGHDVWEALRKRDLVGPTGIITSALAGRLSLAEFSFRYKRL